MPQDNKGFSTPYDMGSTAFEILRQDAERALQDHRMLDALYCLRAMCQDRWHARMRDDVEELQGDYQRMLDYWFSGVKDPSREILYGQFLNRAYFLLASMCHLQMSPDLFRIADDNTDAVMRILDAKPEELDEQGKEEYEFVTCLTSAPFRATGYEKYRGKLQDPEIPLSRKLMAISGLTLSSLYLFDEWKLSLLLDFAQAEELTLRARSLVGAMFVCVAHEKRISSRPELVSRISLLLDEPSFVADVRTVQLQFLLSLNTRQDSKRMDDEILPEMMRAAQEVVKRRGDDLRSWKLDNPSDLEALEMEFNPDWTVNSNDSIRHSMQEFMALQEKGADMFFSNFASIAGRFDFFRRSVAWFQPFSADHPVLKDVTIDHDILNLFFRMRPISNTDKYAYTLLFAKFPQNQMQGFSEYMKKMKGQLEKGGENPDEQDVEPAEAFRTAVRIYVQDFYRYSYLFMTRSTKFKNPFKLNLHFTDCTLLASLAQHPDFLTASADFCFSEQSWPEAMGYLEKLPEGERDAEVYEKMGYCSFQAENYGDAAEYFERALMIRPDSRWALRQLSRVCLHQKQYARALEALKELESLDPENVDTLLRLGECCILNNLPDMAFEKLYKAEYMRSDARTHRALAWCSLSFHKPEQAEGYYAKLLADNPTRADWLNAAHCAWMRGDMQKAEERYMQVVRQQDVAIIPEDFFDEDKTLLLSYGLHADELHFMRDALNRKLSQ